MAIGEWMVRKGTPGGTARVVGKLFSHARETNPEISVEEFAENFFYMRAGPNVGKYHPERELAKLSELTEDFTKFPSSLSGIVRDVLSVEVGSDFDDIYYYDSDPKRRNLYDKVIREELGKFGISEECI